MHWIDWTIVALYALGTVMLGWYFGRGQRRAQDYFSGAMPSSMIGVSLFATLLSTISYLSIPGEVLGKGPIYLVHYLAYPLVFVLLGFVILPVYLRAPVTSAYELLETRLGLSLRLLGAVMFLALRVFPWIEHTTRSSGSRRSESLPPESLPPVSDSSS